MKLIEFCVKNPVTVMVGVILSLLFGAISIASIPLQMTPTVDRPEITVETEYKGAAPLEVEEEVTKRQEEKLNAVEGLTEMTSASREDKSTIVLRFDWGTNKDIARLDVSEKLGLVTDLPPDAERPVIRAVNSDEETPIAWVVVRSSLPINQVREEVDDVIRPRLERVPGVGQVWRFGGRERQVRVTLDFAALSARRITIAQVRDALLRENRNTKGGKIDEGKKRYVIRTVAQFGRLRELEETIVAQANGRPVYLKDVASVRFDYEDPDFHVRFKGEPVVGLGVLRKTGGNTVEVMRNLKAEIRYINETLYKDKGIRLQQVYDETEYIYDSVRMVTDNIWYGGALAVLVLLLFLGSATSTLVIAFSIPISVVATFIFVYALGRSLNIISLAGLAFAVGMVVDNSIVVLEHTYSLRERGAGPLEAALKGAQEMWGGILASTLTTQAVFIPVIFLKVETGQLFRDIAIAIAVAVGLSLIVAVTVVPMLSARWLRVAARRGRWSRLGEGIRFVWAGHLFWRGLMGLHRWLLRGWLRRVAVIVLVVAASLFTAAWFMPPIDYLPQGNRNFFFSLVRTPAGFNLEQQGNILRTLEGCCGQLEEVDRFFAIVRVQDPFLGIAIKREYADLPNMRRILERLRGLLGGIPGVKVFVTQVPLFRHRGSGFIGGTNLEVDIRGDSLETLQRLSEEAQERIGRLRGVNFVNSSFDLGNPELQVRIDREKAADLGLRASEVGYVVETLVNGTLAGTFREDGKERDIVLRGSAEEFSRTQDLSRIVLFTPAGRMVRLTDIAEVRPAAGPTKVERIDRDRAIKLTVNLAGDEALQAAIERVEREALSEMRPRVPPGYSITVTGKAKDLAVAWDALKWSFLLALLITYLLMCSLFESWSYPFIIMFSVPMAASGGVLAVWLMNRAEPTIKMDVLTMLGFILLVGVVVNNAILLVHQTLNYMRAGLPYREALLESVSDRTRPIFMSTATTVFGMLPLVLRSGAGSELYRGLGAAVVGGMALSTLFTLVLVPALFSLWMDAAARLKGAPAGPGGAPGDGRGPGGTPEVREPETSPERTYAGG